ncbi:arylsulfatase [Sunxiuqinia sp. A32]|uniref:arylsulfatase n=1 Tax=Sunxiuqinia sp. A32 TaxID=3461496 RepID=UPI0040460060
MKPRLITMSVMAVVVILGACNGEGKKTENASNTKLKPNIIYILADDLGYGDLSCYGQQYFQTPNIDQLAAEGMRFTQHYSGSTVCAPSRSSLMTGQTTGHTYIRGNKEWNPEGQWPMSAESFTIAEMLKDAGYITGAFGKWGLGYPGSEGDPNMQGFDEFYGYNCQRMGHHYYPYHMWHNQEKDILEDNSGTATGTYGPDIIHKYALEFLDTNRDTSFFMYYPSIIPHAELFAPEKYLQKYRGLFNPENKFEGVDDGPKYRNGAYGTQLEAHAAFAAMINVLDDEVGEIVSKLKELGIADNTIILFSSDNGPHQEGGADPDYFDSNGPLKGYKRDLYEGGVRAPMIAWWPGKIEAGSTSDHISAFWDVMPTVADLVGIDTPENIDGISFLPTLLGEGNQEQHEYLYWEFHEKGGRLAVRKGNWKAVRYNVSKGDKPTELYDLSTDIAEEKNVADQYPEIVKEMDEIMKNARTESKVYQFKAETYSAK